MIIYYLWSSRIDHPEESIYTRVMGLLDGKTLELVTLPQPQRKQTHAAAANDFKEEDIVLLMEAQIMLSKVECALGMELS